MKEYKILSVKTEELGQSLETIRAAFSEKVEQFGYTPENYPTCAAFLTLEELEAAKAKKVHMYAAWVNDEMAGYVQLEKKAEGVYSFQRFSVLPKYQHMGIGRALVAHCKKRAASYGAKRLVLLMRYANKTLFEFYKSCGFTLVRLGEDEAHPFRFAIMELDIGCENAQKGALKYKNYLFDLDGTLTDPGVGIKNSIRYALEQFGLPQLEDKTLDCFIGPPLVDSFQKYCGVSFEDATELTRLYRVYFADKGLFENEVLDGAKEILEALASAGGKIYLATSKPVVFATKILDYFGLSAYFDFIGGSNIDGSRNRKKEVISYVLEENQLRAGESLMIGDRIYDIEGARECGLDCAGVLVGYGSVEELSSADYVCPSLLDIIKL